MPNNVITHIDLTQDEVSFIRDSIDDFINKHETYNEDLYLIKRFRKKLMNNYKIAYDSNNNGIDKIANKLFKHFISRKEK